MQNRAVGELVPDFGFFAFAGAASIRTRRNKIAASQQASQMRLFKPP